MACFLVPAAEALAVTLAVKAVRSKEKKVRASSSAESAAFGKVYESTPFSGKLCWLRNLLWGGSALAAFEHLWHGEITPWFPFLTAASSAADTAAMWREMATVGVGMAALVTAVWCGMLAVSKSVERKAAGTGVLDETPV